MNKLALEGIQVTSKTIGVVIFTGSGLDDMTVGGHFTGTENRDFLVEIDSTGAPDTFKWSKDGGTTWTENVPITGSAQLLTEGITVTFAATTGHTGGDEWAFSTIAVDPRSIRKTTVLLEYVSLAPLGDVTTDVIDLDQIREAALTIRGDFDALAVKGMKVEIFTSPDNVLWDTQPWASTGLEPVLNAGSTEQRTSNLRTIPRYLKIKVTDLEKGIGNLSVILMDIEER